MTDKESFFTGEMKEQLFSDYGWCCGICKKSLLSGVPQLAHRIPQSKRNIKKYGKEVIHHKLNMIPVESLECNAAASIAGDTIAIELLVNEIKADLICKKEKTKGYGKQIETR